MTDCYQTVIETGAGSRPAEAERLKSYLESGYELRYGPAWNGYREVIAKGRLVEAQGGTPARYEFEGLTGKHSLDADSSDAARLADHWAGFCANNRDAYRDSRPVDPL